MGGGCRPTISKAVTMFFFSTRLLQVFDPDNPPLVEKKHRFRCLKAKKTASALGGGSNGRSFARMLKEFDSTLPISHDFWAVPQGVRVPTFLQDLGGTQ